MSVISLFININQLTKSQATLKNDKLIHIMGSYFSQFYQLANPLGFLINSMLLLYRSL